MKLTHFWCTKCPWDSGWDVERAIHPVCPDCHRRDLNYESKEEAEISGIVLKSGDDL